MESSIPELNHEKVASEEHHPGIQKILSRWAVFCMEKVLLIVRYISRERVVKVAGTKNNAKILDVATGVGRQAFAFANRGLEVTGIDISEEKISRAIGRRCKNTNFKLADAKALPFTDNQFDVSCASFVFHEIPTNVRERILLEMIRVTRPQGLIMIADYALPVNRIGKCLIYHFIKFCENIYYPEFIKSDLNGHLSNFDIEVIEEYPVLWGSGRILKAINRKKPLTQSFRAEVTCRPKDVRRASILNCSA